MYLKIALKYGACRNTADTNSHGKWFFIEQDAFCGEALKYLPVITLSTNFHLADDNTIVVNTTCYQTTNFLHILLIIILIQGFNAFCYLK